MEQQQKLSHMPSLCLLNLVGCIHPSLIWHRVRRPRTNIGLSVWWWHRLTENWQLLESRTPITLRLPHLPTFEGGACVISPRLHRPTWCLTDAVARTQQ
jgi:hypothetical protein